jgi:hypothetical protein
VDERRRLMEEYSQRAVQLLVDADRQGWFAGGSSLESLASDHEFDILREREQFQQLLTRVKSRSAAGR